MKHPGLAYVLGDAFQNQLSLDAHKWDKEWLRYFSIHEDYQFYFYDMDTEHYALAYSPKSIEKFSPYEFFFTKLIKEMSCSVWVEGKEVVGKTVLEMGCGPGMFGKIAGRLANAYIGIDISQFALSLARLTSPKTCEYVHLSDKPRLQKYAQTADTSVGRNFFIHHNFDDALWLLCFMRDLTKPGGLVVADFYSHPERYDGERRRKAADPLNEKYPSSLFDFTDEDIRRLADEADLECVKIDTVPELENKFATFRVA